MSEKLCFDIDLICMKTLVMSINQSICQLRFLILLGFETAIIIENDGWGD